MSQINVMAGNGWKWFQMEWSNYSSGDLGVRDIKTGGLDIGFFPIGSGKTRYPGLVFLFLFERD